MAESKKYVEVANLAVKDAFDNKYKSTLPKVMTAIVEKAINHSSKLTTKPPADKKAEGFYLDGSLASLTKTEKDNRIVLAGKMTMALATWPKKSMFAFPSASSELDGADPSKIDRDVEELVKALLESALDKAIAELEKRAK